MKRLDWRGECTIWIIKASVWECGKERSHSPLQKAHSSGGQTLLRFTYTEKHSMSSQFFSCRHKTCVRATKMKSGACSALGWPRCRKRRQDQNRDTEQWHESWRAKLAKTCKSDNKHSWLLGGSSLHNSYHLICLSLPLVIATTTTFIFQGFHTGNWAPLCRLLSHPYQPASLKATPRDAVSSNAFWFLTLGCPSSYQHPALGAALLT